MIKGKKRLIVLNDDPQQPSYELESPKMAKTKIISKQRKKNDHENRVNKKLTLAYNPIYLGARQSVVSTTKE